jgi:hypothetical protein
MTAYSVQDMLHGIARSLQSTTINRWIDVEVLPMDAPGAESSVRHCLAVFPQLEAAIDASALRRSTFTMRPLALALMHLAKSSEMLNDVDGKPATALLTLSCKLIDAYEHKLHGCIDVVGELMEVIRSKYLPIKLGYPLDVMATFYNHNLCLLRDDLRLPFLKAGDQYRGHLSKSRLENREPGVNRPLLTLVDVSSFHGWTAHLFTHPALTAMFNSTFETMSQYQEPVWVSHTGEIEPRLLSLVELIEQLQAHSLKLDCFNVDLLLVGQLLDGMLIATDHETEHRARIVSAAQGLVEMTLPGAQFPTPLAANLFKPCRGSKPWLLPTELNGLVQGLCNTMALWSDETDLAPALSLFRRHFFFSAFQGAAVYPTIANHLYFNDLAKVAAPELLDPALQNGIGKKGRSVLADFAIHASYDELKQMLVRTPDLQVRGRIFQDDLGL